MIKNRPDISPAATYQNLLLAEKTATREKDLRVTWQIDLPAVGEVEAARSAYRMMQESVRSGFTAKVFDVEADGVTTRIDLTEQTARVLKIGEMSHDREPVSVGPESVLSALPMAGDLRRFDGYRVLPVVETTAPDGERGYEVFTTLAEAQAEVLGFNSERTLEGAEGQHILWSLYGLRKGTTEHIGDRATEAEALALMYSISGITGAPGQADYPTQALWMITHDHRHGTDAWVVSAHDEPTEKQLVRCLEIDFEPSRDEFLGVRHVAKVTALDWLQGDDEPFVEPEG